MSTLTHPQSVQIRRHKRSLGDPPSALVVKAQDGEAEASDLYYVRAKKQRNDDTEAKSIDDAKNGDIKFAPKTGNELARKLYQLERNSKGRGGKKNGSDDVATFVEQPKEKSARTSRDDTLGAGEEEIWQYAAPERPLKRPSRQPRVQRENEGATRPRNEVERRQMESLATYLHEAAVEEVEREARTKPKVTPPKISGQRARELHRRRVESNNVLSSARSEDLDMSDGDYVYDTYVLATSAAFDTDFDSRPDDFSDVGYLIIAPEDRDLWEAYVDDGTAASDKEQNSDDEDENAEDYCGADYPEDELSEDDEFDRGPYAYRRKGEESDGDGYDSNEAAWSDGEDEVERMMNPFKYRGPRLEGVQKSLAELKGSD